MAISPSPDVGEPKSILGTDLDDGVVHGEWPAAKRAGHRTDDDEAVGRGGEHAQAHQQVGRSRGCEAPDAIEWVEPELAGDLRPPRSVLDDQARFKMEPARCGDRLDILQADLAVTVFPSGDRRLT